MIKEDTRNFFTAGELANMFNISKQSLLYYDKVHLLSPDFISDNGYRHYSIKQFLDLEIIVNMRALNISIADIKAYLENRSKESFLKILKKKTDECQAIIKENQQICNTIERISNDITSTNQAMLNQFTLCFHDDILLRVTQLNEQDDGKCRITKFARHAQKRSHNKGMLPNRAGWIISQENFFIKQDFYHSSAFFTCAPNNTAHKKVLKLVLPAGLYLKLLFNGTFYENGAMLSQRTGKFLELNNLQAVGDIYIMPIENHWFSKSSSNYINKLFVQVENIQKQ